MGMRFSTLFVLIIISATACSVVRSIDTSLEGVEIVEFKRSSDKVVFEIFNDSNYDLKVQSVRHLYIESQTESGWERIAYVPCQCGTPCAEPKPFALARQNAIRVAWGLLSRKCKSTNQGPPDTIESRVEPGIYRLTFTLNPNENGMRLNPEKLSIEFKVN